MGDNDPLLGIQPDDPPPLPQSQGDSWSNYAWLGVFCCTGVGVGMSFEYLALQSKDGRSPAAANTFLLCFIGYWAQTIVGGVCVLSLSLRHSRDPQSTDDPLRGAWTIPVLRALLASAVLDGAAQALNYVGQLNGGYMLFTIFHSSVTIFSCAIAVCMLGAKVSLRQWGGVGLILAGILITAVPNPIQVKGSFFWGIVCSCTGSLFLAASYPFSELVFKLGEEEEIGDEETEVTSIDITGTETVRVGGCVGEEMSCFVGSLLNTVLFTVWTLAYTVPHWQTGVADFVRPGREDKMVFGFVLFGALVGLHSLSFWKSVHRMGTVPCAVAKGAQQAGIFAFSHIIYCRVDSSQCIDSGDTTWEHMQKSVAFVFCCAGVLVYALNRRTDGGDDVNKAEEEQASE